MLVTMSEQQTLTNQLQQHEGDPTKVRLLRLRDATDEPFGAGCFIREADAFSGHPEDLVRDHALCLGKGKKKSWFFCSLAKYDDSPDGPRRKLNAGNGAGDMCRWNVEVGNSQILGSDKTPLGANRRTLSYVLKIENPPNSKRKYRQKSLGWKMIEIGLEQHQAGKQLLLCEVYNSRQACSLPGGDDPSSAPPRPQLSSSSPSRPRPPQPSSSPWAPPPPPQSSWSQPSLNLSLSPPSSSLPQPPSYLSSRLRSSPSPSPPLSPPSSPHPLLGPSCDSKELKFETKLEYDLDWQPGSISPELKHARCWPMGGRRSGCGVAIVKKTSVAPATLVMKFGGSLTQSADGVKKVANLISSFPDGGSENPVVVLSAIGNTNVNLLVAAGKALSCDPQEANAIHELVITKELHLRMIHDLGLDRSIISAHITMTGLWSLSSAQTILSERLLS